MPALRISAPTHKRTLGGPGATSIGTLVAILTFHSSSGSRLWEVLSPPPTAMLTRILPRLSARDRGDFGLRMGSS